jgi:hypothetical protein
MWRLSSHSVGEDDDCNYNEGDGDDDDDHDDGDSYFERNNDGDLYLEDEAGAKESADGHFSDLEYLTVAGRPKCSFGLFRYNNIRCVADLLVIHFLQVGDDLQAFGALGLVYSWICDLSMHCCIIE